MTSIPVPRVFLYASGPNPVGYEWMLMERMPGEPFSKVRNGLPEKAKEQLAATIAEWVHSLARHRFDAIGSLYPSRDTEAQHEGVTQLYPLFPGIDLACPELQVELGPVCHQLYTGDWRLEYSIDHGPFTDLASYALSFAQTSLQEIRDKRQLLRACIAELRTCIGYDEGKLMCAQTKSDTLKPKDDPLLLPARLAGRKTQLWILEQQAFGPPGILHPSDLGLEGDKASYDYRSMNLHSKRAVELVDLIKAVVPSSTIAPGSTALHHWDISQDNVLVDPTTGAPTALLDWEQLVTLPCSLHSSPVIFEPDSGYAGSSIQRRPSTSWMEPELINPCMAVWDSKVMKAAYWRRRRELAGLAEGQDHPDWSKSAPLSERIVDLVHSDYWLSPYAIKSLVDEHKREVAKATSSKVK